MKYTDPLDSKALEREARESREREQLELENVLNDLRWVMSETRGRRSIARWLEFTGVDRSSFHTSGSVMAFNEGQRNVGLKLISQLLQASPELYATILEEFGKK